MQIDEEYLEHHGILGMHWGIRRFQPYPKGYKGDGKTVGKAKKAERNRDLPDIKSMSNEELTEGKRRMQLEREYLEEYMKNHPEQISKGKKLVKWAKKNAADIVTSSARNIGIQITTQVFGRTTNRIARDVFKYDGEFVNPKKGQKDK